MAQDLPSNEPTKEEIIELLEWIQDFMRENDYECGPQGSMVYEDINQKLIRYGRKDPDNEDY